MLCQRDPTVHAIKNFLNRSNFALFSTVNEFACNDAKAFGQGSSAAIALPTSDGGPIAPPASPRWPQSFVPALTIY